MTTIFMLTAVLLGGNESPEQLKYDEPTVILINDSVETGSSLRQPKSVISTVSYNANLSATPSCAAPEPACGVEEVADCGCNAPSPCESCNSCDACNSGCDSCNSCNTGCGCGHGHGGFWARHCLPSTCHAPGNMVQRFPYQSYPKTYYYFRPYNMLHIPNQKALAEAWVENPQLPYSNGVFDKVYAELEAELSK